MCSFDVIQKWFEVDTVDNFTFKPSIWNPQSTRYLCKLSAWEIWNQKGGPIANSYHDIRWYFGIHRESFNVSSRFTSVHRHFGKAKQEEYTFFHKQHERGIIHRNCFHNFHFSCFISPKIICEVGIFWEHSSFFFIFAISARSILFWCFDYRNAVIFRWMREGWKC